MEAVRTIRLYGPLALEFGAVHRYAVKSAAEASRALCAMVPGFEKFLMNSKDKGLGFEVTYDETVLTEEDLFNPSGDAEIHITPVVIGSKKEGLLSIVAGIVLVAVGMWINVGTGGLGTALGNAFIGAGISLIVGGVISLLSPQPKMKSSEKDDRRSYIFNGAINVTSQGASVPVLYGECIVGSVVVSAGINADDNYVVPLRENYNSGGEYSDGGSMMGNVIARAKNEYT